MPVLYRKYRPQIFAEVVGQEPIITTLQNQIKSGQIAHAFLFVGSRGIGKTSVARILAKAVNCQSVNQPISKSANQEPSLSLASSGHLPPAGENDMVQALPDALGEACGECEVCKAVESGNFIDLVEIDAASNTGVDNIRELIEHTKFSPARAKYKVFIIDEAHMLSKGAFNALLKTLEEPPLHAIFILATTEVGKIPPTIISRTQRLDFKRVSPNLIENYLQKVLALEQVKVEEQILQLIAVNAEGGMRDALSLLDKVLSLGPNAELAFILRILGIANISKLEKFAELIFNQQTTLIPEFIKELYEEGVDFITFNKDFLEYLRKILIVKVFQSNSDWGLTSNQITVLENLSQTQTEIKIITIIRLFLRALKEQNFSPSLDLPVLLAGIEASINSSAVLPNVKKKLNPVVTASNIPNLQISTDKNLTEALDSQLSVENINEKWEEFVKKVKSINGPLANLLRTAQILRVNHYKVFISVKYQFHKQNLEQAKNNDLITKILHEVYNYPLTLIAEVKENQASDLPRVEDLSNALKVFGGELVE
jgi:DNA polymerase-3 subunit gamma/tau